MSRESITWLNTNTLIGFTSRRGTAHHDAAQPPMIPRPKQPVSRHSATSQYIDQTQPKVVPQDSVELS